MEILYSDEALVVVNKPPGFVVHDAPGVARSILRVLREEQGMDGLTPVHRLDKDASGVLLLAREKSVASDLQRVWSTAEKTYLALCAGSPAQPAGLIDAPLLENQTGRPDRLRVQLRHFSTTHPGQEVPPLPKPKTCAVHVAGRPSQTNYRVVERFGARWTLLEARPRQGRMHQIRVHLAHLGCPLAVDALYGQRAALAAADIGDTGTEALLDRMPLHAWRLNIAARNLSFEAPLAPDIEATLVRLRTLSAKH